VFLFLFLTSVGALAIYGVVQVRAARKALPAPGEPLRDRGEAVRRVLKHLQRKTSIELDDGTAAVVQGTARAIPGVPLLRSPLMGIECIGYHLDIRATHLASGLHFPQLREEARCVAFDLEDAHGTLRVSADGLELAITDGPIGRWNPPLPPEIAQLLPAQYQYWPVTVEEGVLLPGAPVLVCGVAVTELAATDYRDGAQLRVMRATATFPLVASTDADLFTTSERPILPEELRTRR
jgi:hypothetical protein